MKEIFTLAGVLLTFASFSQIPLLDSWMLNTTGATASYQYYPGPPPNTTTVNLTDSADVIKICHDANYVYVYTNGLASYTMGPWQMNPNQPSAHPSTYRFTKSPAEETGTKVAQPVTGALGIAINGVKLYGAGDARSYNSVSGQNDAMGDGLWNGDAWASEGSTMDATGSGHPDQNGNYHYHATPHSFYADPSTTHSPIIGWAFDGFPIYGPYGYSDSLSSASPVVRMQTSYQLRSISDRTTLPDGTTSTPAGPAINATFPLGTYWEDYEYVASLGHLDEYNGRWCVTPDFPSGTYAYFITMDGSGTPQFPYIIGLEYYGVVNAAEIGGASGNIIIPGGVTCLSTSGTAENALSFEVYPNPVHAILNIEGVNGAAYAITDQLGRAVGSGVVNGQINLEHLATGTYIIRVTKDNQSSFMRFIKD